MHSSRGGESIPDPNSLDTLEDIWTYTRERLKSDQGAHLDEALRALGDRLSNDAEPPQAAERLAYHAWKQSSPQERQTLTHLFIRAVGHATFLQEDEADAEG